MTPHEQGILFFQFVVFFAFLFATAAIDANHYKKGEWVENKRDRWLQRALFMIGLSLASHILDALFFALWWMASFDMILNFLRGLDSNHLGNKGWDKFWSDKPTLYTVMKVVAFIGGCIGLLFFDHEMFYIN